MTAQGLPQIGDTLQVRIGGRWHAAIVLETREDAHIDVRVFYHPDYNPSYESSVQYAIGPWDEMHRPHTMAWRRPQ